MRPASRASLTSAEALEPAFASTSSFPTVSVLEDIRRDAQGLAQNVAGLLDSLRAALAHSADCTQEHLEVYRSASESVVADTRESVRTASAFVDACVQLGSELEALEKCAEQTCARPARCAWLAQRSRRRQLRATVDQLEQAAQRVLPPPPSRTASGLFRGGGS